MAGALLTPRDLLAQSRLCCNLLDAEICFSDNRVWQSREMALKFAGEQNLGNHSLFRLKRF
jgi:hypothetical protein